MRPVQNPGHDHVGKFGRDLRRLGLDKIARGHMSFSPKGKSAMSITVYTVYDTRYDCNDTTVLQLAKYKCCPMLYGDSSSYFQCVEFRLACVSG